MAKKVLIIGGVATGMKTASRLRRRDKEAEIIVLEKGSQVSYGACGFPYYVSGDVKKFSSFTHTPQGMTRDVEYFKNVKGVEVLTGHEALSIDRDNKIVTAFDKVSGKEKEFKYDVLVLGTGATPTKLSLPGSDALGIHNFWYPWEVLSVDEEIKEAQVSDVAIIGAGLIGMELAEAFSKRGLKVNVIEMQDRVLPQILDLEMADLLKKPLSKAGINLFLEEKTIGFEESNGRVAAVKTDKRTIPAQLVIVAVGVRPNISLAKDSGLEIGVTGAIAVNEYLQTSDASIYAGGDCAENTNIITKDKIFAPMGSTANKHGRVIADNICGDKIKYPGVLATGICQILDWHAGSTGLNERMAQAAGIDFETVVVPGFDRLGYMPGAKRIILKLFADKETQKVIGAQIVGMGGVDKRIDVLATAISFRATLDDLSNIDFAYAPPFSGPIDNIATAANVLKNKIEGQSRSINPKDFKNLRGKSEYTLLDVRTEGEFIHGHIAGCHNCINLPLDKLRGHVEELLENKDCKIICSCQINLRGYEAETILRGLDYENVQSLEGGMSGWPYDVEKETKK